MATGFYKKGKAVRLISWNTKGMNSAVKVVCWGDFEHDENMTEFVTENSTTQPNDTEGFQKLSKYLYIVLIVLSLIGNGLVIFVTGYKMKTTVNSIWFLNLATADFIFSFSPILHMISNLNSSICSFLLFLTRQNMFASIFFLTVISLDRCLCTWMVVWAKNKRTVVKARIVSLLVWVLSISCGLLFTFYNGMDMMPLVIFEFIVGFLIPFLIIASSYTAIGVRVRQLKMKKFKVFRVIAVVFFVCWLPYYVSGIYITNAFESDLFESFTLDAWFVIVFISVAQWLVMLNSCLNPILYVFMCDEFKKTLKESLLLVLETAFAEDHLMFHEA
ncbi:C3a anaphylatoxin chemotactic receptor-like [Danio aesculapii]|uniref:C3a anaphylatoxin chemotactic receptor-like n=1 Tax=Danio aesculapii TaxID=1142201 RepID=UPI0024BF27FC|nr:C3a anaphylatoxin chemotactic receptor-like [Danio aesculapii]